VAERFAIAVEAVQHARELEVAGGAVPVERDGPREGVDRLLEPVHAHQRLAEREVRLAPVGGEVGREAQRLRPRRLRLGVGRPQEEAAELVARDSVGRRGRGGARVGLALPAFAQARQLQLGTRVIGRRRRHRGETRLRVGRAARLELREADVEVEAGDARRLEPLPLGDRDVGEARGEHGARQVGHAAAPLAEPATGRSRGHVAQVRERDVGRDEVDPAVAIDAEAPRREAIAGDDLRDALEDGAPARHRLRLGRCAQQDDVDVRERRCLGRRVRRIAEHDEDGAFALRVETDAAAARGRQFAPRRRRRDGGAHEQCVARNLRSDRRHVHGRFARDVSKHDERAVGRAEHGEVARAVAVEVPRDDRRRIEQCRQIGQAGGDDVERAVGRAREQPRLR
jgi:hypothetical protein